MGSVVGAGIAGLIAWDELDEATQAAEDAKAALIRKDACWKRFILALDEGACN
jgi:hypothetical protein